MKMGIAIHAFGESSWIGEVYYFRNMVFQLSLNNKINKYFNIFIFTTPKLKDVFLDISENIKILIDNNNKLDKAKRIIKYKRYNIKFVFPSDRDMKILGVKTISWIPDFQPDYLPELFKKDDLKKRRKKCEKIAKSDRCLILSSNNALMDFNKFYVEKRRNVYVVHFVSYIEPMIKKLTQEKENCTLKKFQLLEKKYICIANQFWKHKNHIIILNAMKLYFERNPKSDFLFVFTGKMEDYRNPNYINELKKLFKLPEIACHTKITGFIDREEQIAIMKNAEYIIQPSLFEGWGTVLEDAKVLDQTVLLSDIPVHREQKNKKCILFNPYNPKQLADLIEEENKKKHNKDIEAGIMDMRERAKKYSLEFQEVIGKS